MDNITETAIMPPATAKLTPKDTSARGVTLNAPAKISPLPAFGPTNEGSAFTHLLCSMELLAPGTKRKKGS